MTGQQLAVRADRMTTLHTWVDAASQTHQIAQGLARTSFVPATMRGKPDEITGAILAGAEIGLDPMSALRSIDIIDGTPALRALTLRALVQARGHEVWVDKSTDTEAVVCGRRAGSDRTQKSVWTIDRARRANLAGKRNWQTNPTAMLIARATAELCRLVAADAILGMPYAAEEIRDGVTDDADEPAAATPRPARRKVQRDPIPAVPVPDPEPAPSDEPDDEPPAELDWPAPAAIGAGGDE